MFRVGVASRFGLLYNYQNESRRRPVGFLILRQGDIGLLQVVQSLVNFDNMNTKRFREPVTRLNPSPPYAKMVFPWPTPLPVHSCCMITFASWQDTTARSKGDGYNGQHLPRFTTWGEPSSLAFTDAGRDLVPAACALILALERIRRSAGAGGGAGAVSRVPERFLRGEIGAAGTARVICCGGGRCT
jgi:hypothetical protein